MIRRKRLEKRLTQKQLARILKINRSYISKLENKAFNNPSPKLIIKIAKSLEIEACVLFKWFS